MSDLTKHEEMPRGIIDLDICTKKAMKKFKKQFEKAVAPVYLFPNITDMTRLTRRFGNLIKRFSSYEEMSKWLKKAKKLNPGIEI